MKHKYILEVVPTDYIRKSLQNIGYFNNSKMLSDYIIYMIQDILDKNGDTYITKNINYSKKIQRLLGNTTPHFVIKSRYPRRTFILDIYFGGGDFNELKEKYKGLSYFSDFCIIHWNGILNFTGSKFLSNEDGQYLYQNFEIFKMSFKYWQACATDKAIYWSYIPKIDIKEFTLRLDNKKFEFEQALNDYAIKVASQDHI